MTHLLFAEGNFLEVISVNFWQMIISILNLVILYLILKKFLFKPVKRTLEARRQQVDELYSSAETAKTEAEAARVEYTAKLDRADESAREIVSDATRRANERAEERRSTTVLPVYETSGSFWMSISPRIARSMISAAL